MNIRILAALCGALLSLAASADPAKSTPQHFAPETIRADFDALYDGLKASHYDLYARRDKASYDALFAKMRGGFDQPLTRGEVESRFQTFVAYGRVAHARIEPTVDAYGAFREAGGKAFPLGIRVAGGVARVAQNGSGDASIAIGDEIVSLDGKPMREWIARLGAHVSADNDYMLGTLLEGQFGAALWRERGAAARYRLVIRKADGATRNVRVAARSRAEFLAAVAQAPKQLDLSWTARESRLLDDGVAYLRPGPFYNAVEGATDMWDATAFKAFIDGAFAQFIKANARSVVIDLRDNPGGDNSFSDRMIAWFADRPWRFCGSFRVKVSQGAIDTNARRVPLEADPNGMSHRYVAEYAKRKLGDVFTFDLPEARPREGVRFSGKVYLLINRHSYSNTANVAALAQDLGFATIVGEETSDLATTYGAMEQFALPRTGITVGFPKAYIVRISGDTTPRGVVPDVAIETPLPEASDDPVLRRAVAIAAGGAH